MTPNFRLTYRGHYRTTMTHLRSGSVVETDAPVDNRGKGERFSPTDLLAASLASCSMTIMGMAADEHGIDLQAIHADVGKQMASHPRRVSRIIITLEIMGKFSEKDRKILEHAALTCPVYQSLHPDIEKTFHFSFKSGV